MVSLPHIIETALLLLVAFLIGCFLGYALRSLTRPRSNVKPSAAGPELESPPEPAEDTVLAPAKPRNPPAKPRAAARSPRAQTALSPKPPRRRRAKPESPDR